MIGKRKKKTEKANESTQQFVHWKSKPSIHPQFYIPLILSMLHFQWMEHTYHGHHCRKVNKNALVIRKQAHTHTNIISKLHTHPIGFLPRPSHSIPCLREKKMPLKKISQKHANYPSWKITVRSASNHLTV